MECVEQKTQTTGVDIVLSDSCKDSKIHQDLKMRQ